MNVVSENEYTLQIYLYTIFWISGNHKFFIYINLCIVLLQSLCSHKHKNTRDKMFWKTWLICLTTHFYYRIKISFWNISIFLYDKNYMQIFFYIFLGIISFFTLKLKNTLLRKYKNKRKNWSFCRYINSVKETRKPFPFLSLKNFWGLRLTLKKKLHKVLVSIFRYFSKFVKRNFSWFWKVVSTLSNLSLFEKSKKRNKLFNTNKKSLFRMTQNSMITFTKKNIYIYFSK